MGEQSVEEVSAGAKSSGNLRPLAPVRVQWTGFLSAARREERSNDTFVVLWLHSQFVFYTCRVKLYLLTNTSVTLAFKEVFVVAFNKTVVLNLETLLIVLLIQILYTIVPLTILRVK